MGEALRKYSRAAEMPLNLKGILIGHSIAHDALAAAIRQTNGDPLSRTALSLIINWNDWPRLTPAETIKAQAEAFLLEHGVPPEEVSTCWQPTTEERFRERGLVGAHTGGRAATPRLASVPRAPKPEFEPMEVQMLSPAAKRQFKLFRDPFQDDINGPEDVFMTESQRYVLEAMLQTALLGGITAVIGESGSGKTTLRKLLQHRIARDRQNIRTIFPHTLDKTKLTTGAICVAIIKDLQPESTVRSSLEAQARQVKEVLLSSSRAGFKHVLMIEEAHDLSVQTLKYLKRFYEIESDDGFGKVLSIVLVAQPEMRIKLDVARYPEAREFINRCEVATLEPMADHLSAYLGHKLERAGAKAAAVFAEDAYDAIRARWTRVEPATRTVRNHLYPLIVNNTATRAMNRAAELGLPLVTADLIKEL